jgi:hypothetical protein
VMKPGDLVVFVTAGSLIFKKVDQRGITINDLIDVSSNTTAIVIDDTDDWACYVFVSGVCAYGYAARNVLVDIDVIKIQQEVVKIAKKCFA